MDEWLKDIIGSQNMTSRYDFKEIDPEVLAKIRKVLPNKIAEELCSVQPMENMEKVFNDPLVNQMLTNFVNRQRGE